MQSVTPQRDAIARMGAARQLGGAEFATIRRTMRRYDIVRQFLQAGPSVVLRCCLREPACASAVLRVLWQRRRLARAMRRRGLPAWLASRQ